VNKFEEGQKRGDQNEMGGVFGQLFGNMGGGVRRGQNAKMHLQVTLDDIYKGNTLNLRIQKQKLCPKCKGSGAASKKDVKKCEHCDGNGHTIQRVQIAPGFVQQMQNQCPHCSGTGKTVKHKCSVCKGNRVTKGESPLDIPIDQGIPDGHEIVFEMEGEQAPDMLPGDIIFIVQTKPHSMFTRDGNDLKMKMEINLLEALTGFTKTFEHMDGRTVKVSRSGVTPPGFVKTVKGEGMPLHNLPSEKGNLHVTFEIKFPDKLNDKQKDIANQMLVDVF